MILVLGLWSAFHPTLASRLARLPGDAGDTALNHYLLEHSWYWLTRTDYCGSLWSPPFFHPQPLVLAYSENLLGAAPPYWLLRAALPAVPAFALWLLLAAALTYAATAWTLQRLGVRPVLAAAGAYLFAFGLPRLAQLGHPQLLPHWFAPLAVFAAWRVLERPTVPALAGLLTASYLQVLASIYLGWFLLVGLGLFGAVGLALDRGARTRLAGFLRARWLAVGGLVVVWAGLLAALFAPYREANRGFHRSFAEVLELTPRPADWLTRGVTGELCLFPGWTVFALVGLAAVRPGSRPVLVRASLLTAAVLVLVSLRFGTWTAWHGIYSWAPGGTAIRAVGRVVFTAELFALVAGLVALDAWLAAWPRGGRWLAVGILVASLWDQRPPAELPSFDATTWADQVERLAARLGPGMPAYVEWPSDRPFWEAQVVAMWAGLRANVPVVNGYSGRYPRGYPDWSRPMTSDDLRRWLGGTEIQVVRDASEKR